MKWTALSADIRSLPIQNLVEGWSFIETARFVFTVAQEPRVILSQQIRTKIYDHLKTKNVEQGGLLIGRVYAAGVNFKSIFLIEVLDSIECRNFRSTSVSLSMNSDVWQDANEKSEDGLFVVGWYHSHPNLGAFFSGTDKKTQRNFFHHNYSLGLVIDPIRQQERWFKGAESLEVSSNCIVQSHFPWEDHKQI